MKFFALAGALVICSSLLACAAGDATEPPAAREAGPIADRSKPPNPSLPPGPPPRHLIVRDLRPGTGAAIPRRGDVRIWTNFVAVSYKTRKPYEVQWNPRGSFNIGFGPGLEIKGWEKGLVGMRVGGRRELIVPARLAYGKGALLYVVDLLGVR